MSGGVFRSKFCWMFSSFPSTSLASSLIKTNSIGQNARLQSLLKRGFRWCWVYLEFLSRRVSLIFLRNLFRAYIISTSSLYRLTDGYRTPSRTNPTGAATTLTRLAIPIVPAAIPPHSATVSAIRSEWFYRIFIRSRRSQETADMYPKYCWWRGRLWQCPNPKYCCLAHVIFAKFAATYRIAARNYQRTRSSVDLVRWYSPLRPPGSGFDYRLHPV